MNIHVLLHFSAWDGATQPMAFIAPVAPRKRALIALYSSQSILTSEVKVDSPSASAHERRDRRRRRRMDGVLLPSTVYTWYFPSMHSKEESLRR